MGYKPGEQSQGLTPTTLLIIPRRCSAAVHGAVPRRAAPTPRRRALRGAGRWAAEGEPPRCGRSEAAARQACHKQPYRGALQASAQSPAGPRQNTRAGRRPGLARRQSSTGVGGRCLLAGVGSPHPGPAPSPRAHPDSPGLCQPSPNPTIGVDVGVVDDARKMSGTTRKMSGCCHPTHWPISGILPKNREEQEKSPASPPLPVDDCEGHAAQGLHEGLGGRRLRAGRRGWQGVRASRPAAGSLRAC